MYADMLDPFLFHSRLSLALQDMLPTIMSQMGMSTEGAFAGRAEQQTGNGQSGANTGQAGAEGDDEVPGRFNHSSFTSSYSSFRPRREFR